MQSLHHALAALGFRTRVETDPRLGTKVRVFYDDTGDDLGRWSAQYGWEVVHRQAEAK